MYAVLVDLRGACNSQTVIWYGSLEDIKGLIIENCEMIYLEDWQDNYDDKEEMRDDNDMEEYFALKRKKILSPEALSNFNFRYSDMTTYTDVVVDSWEALKKRFEQYKSDKECFFNWKLVENAEFDDETLSSLSFELSEVLEGKIEGYKYLYED